MGEIVVFGDIDSRSYSKVLVESEGIYRSRMINDYQIRTVKEIIARAYAH